MDENGGAGEECCVPSPSSLMSLFCSRVVRKSIARVLTVINQTQKENLRKFYKVSREGRVVLGYKEQNSSSSLARGAVW